MRSSVFLRRSHGIALAAVTSASLVFAGASAHADVKICQALEQRYEQIERGATTLDLTSSPTRSVANRLYQRLGFDLRGTNVYRLVL